MKDSETLLQDFFTQQRQQDCEQAPQITPQVVALLTAQQRTERRVRGWSIGTGAVVFTAALAGAARYYWDILCAVWQQIIFALDGLLGRGTSAVLQWVDAVQQEVAKVVAITHNFPYSYVVCYLLLLGLGIALLLFIDHKLRNIKKVQTI